MEAKIIETVAKIAGIGGIAFGIFLLLFRDFIRKTIFPNLTKGQAYKLLRLFLLLTWSVAILGIVGWIYIEMESKDSKEITKAGIRPTLVFSYAQDTGWDLENVGSIAAMDILVSHQIHHESKWIKPTRVYPLRPGAKTNLFWVGHNPDKLGAIYQDESGNEYHSFCDEDRTVLKSKRFLPEWKESQIGKGWEYQL